jgi:hypothetical protein
MNKILLSITSSKHSNQCRLNIIIGVKNQSSSKTLVETKDNQVSVEAAL